MKDKDDGDYLQALISRMFPISPINNWPRIIQYYLIQSLFRSSTQPNFESLPRNKGTGRFKFYSRLSIGKVKASLTLLLARVCRQGSNFSHRLLSSRN